MKKLSSKLVAKDLKEGLFLSTLGRVSVCFMCVSFSGGKDNEDLLARKVCVL
jgi:hypothetical protein